MSTTPPLHNSSKPQFATGETSSVKFSGIVVTFNDDRHLNECLAALSFCDEFIVVDLGSKDQSTQIAARFGARIIRHEWVPAVEYVREFATAQAKHQWIVFMDPDLIFPAHLIPTIRARIQQDPCLGVISIPYRNYFLGKPVKYGRWGGSVVYPAVFRKDAMAFHPLAHRGFRLRQGFNSITLKGTEADVIKHYWVDSLDHLHQKCKRYIPLEGPARYADGERFSYWRLLFEVPYAVLSSLFLKRGILDGWMGVYLSYFYGWLTWKYLLSLRDHQRKLEKEGLARPGKPSKLFRMLVKVARKMRAVCGKILHYLPLPVSLPWGAWCLAWDDVMGRHIRQHEDFEQGEQSFLLRFLKPGMTVLDIGAHHGLYTLLASKKVGSEGHVIAFEPSPRELRRLRWNLFINRCRNVCVVPFAVGNSEGTAEFFVCLGKETGCNSLRPPVVPDPVKKIQVPVTTLDRYIEKFNVKHVDFIKIDAEGAELDVFKGGIKLLSNYSPLVLCEFADKRTEPWGYRSVDIYNFLTAHNYWLFSFTPEGKLRPCPRKEYFNENLLAVSEKKLTLIASFMETEANA